MKKQLRSSIKEIIKNKRYLIVVYLPYDPDKHFYPKIRRNFYGTEAEAKAYERNWLYELEHPEEYQEEAGSGETVSEWLAFWLENDVPILLKWEQNTLRRAKGIVKHNLEPNIGDIALSDLKADDILAMYRKLGTDGGRYKRPLSNRTLRYIHTILNQALRQAVVRGKITSNPCEGLIPAPSKEKAKEKWVVLDEKELTAFLNALREDKYYPLIYTAAYTGVRQSEALGLKWGKIKWKTKTILIDMALHKVYDNEETEYEHRSRTKNDSSTREIDVSGRLINVLKTHEKQQVAKGIKTCPDDLVFTDDKGEPIDATDLVGDFRKLAKRHGHEGMSFHHLRHTHATILLSNGEYVNEVAARLGHANPKTTYSIYGHVLPKNKRRLSTKFDKYVPVE